MEMLSSRLSLFSEWTGRCIAWLTLTMVLFTFCVVVLRYLFNVGFIWMQESITYMHAVVFMLGAAYTLKHDGHVRVDVVYRLLSYRARAVVDLFGTLFLLFPVCAFIFYISWEYVAASWAVREVSQEAGGIPGVYLLKSVIPLMAFLLFLQGVAQGLTALMVITGRTRPKHEEHSTAVLPSRVEQTPEDNGAI